MPTTWGAQARAAPWAARAGSSWRGARAVPAEQIPLDGFAVVCYTHRHRRAAPERNNPKEGPLMTTPAAEADRLIARYGDATAAFGYVMGAIHALNIRPAQEPEVTALLAALVARVGAP
ncbi:MAG: hypothetical protein ACREQ5_15380 [Candidatus Dormibacteria bacterium]